MIFDEWRKFRGWLVLEYFLRTCREVHVKELARELNISPYTASYYLRFYGKEGILSEKRKGNLALYSLSDNSLVRNLKKFYIVGKIYPIFKRLCKKKGVISAAIYGSYASGTYDEYSDIDLLLISQEKQSFKDIIKKLENITDREVNITIFSVGEWRKLKRNKNDFAMAVISNHILLCGAEL
jgi:hypothetical protein